MPVAESSILQPRHANYQSPDDWPSFTIIDVNVVSEKTGEPTKLLDAHKDNPLRLTGRLRRIDEESKQLVKDSNYRKYTIEVTNIVSFAFAEYPEDGTYAFWAAGQAGWFEIESVLPEYQPLLDEMGVATSMLYFIADWMRRTRLGHGPVDEELKKYVSRLSKDYCTIGKYSTRFTDFREVQKAFDDQRNFLIASMFEGTEGIDWKEAPMLKFYQKKFPEDVDRIRARIMGIAPATKPKVDQKKRKSESPHVTEDQRKRRRGRPRRDSPPGQPKTPKAIQYSDSVLSDYDDGGDSVVPRKRKSILHPSGSKYSRKARKSTGRRRSVPGFPEPSTGDDEDDEERTPQADESPITTIRNGQQLHDITTKGKPRRRPSQSPPPPDFLPRKFLELKVVDYDVHSLEPQGPGDLWTCPFEGCYNRVHKASSAKGKKSIQDHFMAHESSAADKISLALNESRPYLPVNNLLRKLQAIAPNIGEEDLEAPGRKFVAPIRRKY